jgi:hypothetical protein
VTTPSPGEACPTASLGSGKESGRGGACIGARVDLGRRRRVAAAQGRELTMAGDIREHSCGEESRNLSGSREQELGR